MGSKRSPCMIRRTSVFKKLVQGAYSRHRLRKVQNVFTKHVEDSIHKTSSIRMRKNYARDFKALVQDRILQPHPIKFVSFSCNCTCVSYDYKQTHLSIQTELFCTIHLHNPRGCTARNSGCAPYPTFWRRSPLRKNPYMSATPGMMEPAAMIYKPEDESEVSEGEDRNLKKKPPKKSGWGVVVGVVDAIFCIC